MFHVMLILISLVFLVIIGSILLFGLILVMAGILGGATVTALIKNKIVKYLLFIACCILLLVGSFCAIPLICMFLGFSSEIITIISAFILISIGILSIVGIIISKSIGKKIGRVISIVAFSIAGSIAFVIIGSLALVIMM